MLKSSLLKVSFPSERIIDKRSWIQSSRSRLKREDCEVLIALIQETGKGSPWVTRCVRN